MVLNLQKNTFQNQSAGFVFLYQLLTVLHKIFLDVDINHRYRHKDNILDIFQGIQVHWEPMENIHSKLLPTCAQKQKIKSKKYSF